MDAVRIVVVGASAGGVRALQSLAAQLPAGFPAPILVAQHIGSYPSILPELLMRSGPLRALHPPNGERLRPGRIFIAPPDHHMLVEGNTIRVTHGPREHHARPAIDRLFRSAAISWGSSVIGVLLTGALDDGTSGLQAIKECGGVAVVQDPEDAEVPSMPLSAIRYLRVDHCVPLADMGELLARLVKELPAPAVVGHALERDTHENDVQLEKGDSMTHLASIGTPSTFICPDCQGPLWEIQGADPPRFRCHTGHAFTLRSFSSGQSRTREDALWRALRALQEKELLMKTMAADYRGAQVDLAAQRLQVHAEQAARHANILRALIEEMPAPPE